MLGRTNKEHHIQNPLTEISYHPQLKRKSIDGKILPSQTWKS
jgi:hypothetical protein